MAELNDIDMEITSPARGIIDEIMINECQEGVIPHTAQEDNCVQHMDSMDQPCQGVKRKAGDKPPLPNSKRCHPKSDPYNATGSRRRAEVWNHVIDSPRSTPSAPRSICKYCSKEYLCDSLKHGTGSMKKHVENLCDSPKNPYTAARMAEVDEQLGQPKLYNQSKINQSSFEGTKSGLKAMPFTQETARLLLTKMIITDELPFDHVEGVGFRAYSYYLQPKFILPSRFTIKRDVMDLYFEEKRKLKNWIKNERVCLTTDGWTSIQNLSYMCLTCHWIDSNWDYHKRILNFCLLPNHKGEAIGKTIEACLADWGIERILTITLDNASANNSAIKHLKKKKTGFLWKDNIADHAYLHVRCCAHIVNLIVRAGIGKMNDSIARIRNAVRYVRSSPSRTQSFESCVKASNIAFKHKLILDVETRWNYTYLMLESAQKYERAFDRLCEEDGKYTQYFSGWVGGVSDDEEIEEDDDSTHAVKGKTLRLGPPGDSDWENARVLIKFLKLFYDMTLKFSGSTFVTSNEFFHQTIHLHNMLKKLSTNSDPLLSSMTDAMNLKFKKYWGDFDSINGLVYVAILLDPRYKSKYIKYSFGIVYGEKMGVVLGKRVEEILRSLYEQYNRKGRKPSSSTGCSSSSPTSFSDVEECIDDEKDENDVRSNWERLVQEEHNLDHHSEIDRYLGEPAELSKANGISFDILDWWKANSTKYPIISQIARHVLAIPVSTVASESAFSTGGRILDPYRSSLAPNTTEALICTQNWLMSKPCLLDLKRIGCMIDDEAKSEDIQHSPGIPPPPPGDTQQSSNSVC